MLHKIIDESDGVEVHTMVKDSIEANVPEVELKVGTLKSRQDVGEILVRSGFVKWDSCQGSSQYQYCHGLHTIQSEYCPSHPAHWPCTVLHSMGLTQHLPHLHLQETNQGRVVIKLTP